MKKFLAALMSVVLLAGSFTGMNVEAANSVPADNQQQIVNVGGSKPSKTPTTDEDKMLAEDGVTLSKTLVKTDKENYFDITLELNTWEKLTELEVKESTAVVLVIDKSFSMDGEPLQEAKDAAKYFINLYCNDTELGTERELGIVTFNSHASTTQALRNVYAETQEARDVIVDDLGKVVQNIDCPEDADKKYTNTEGGLKLAQNILKESGADHKFVILLTDGLPTTYIEGEKTDKEYLPGYSVYTSYYKYGDGKVIAEKDLPAVNADGTAQDGVFIDYVKRVACLGTSYSNTAAIKAKRVAEDIKKEMNLFCVGIDLDVTVQDYDDSMGPRYSIVERTSSACEIGDPADEYAFKSWLGDVIAGGVDNCETTYCDGDNIDELQTAYRDILEDIVEVSRDAVENAWFVADPMGEDVEFKQFINLEQSGNVAEFKDGVLDWNLEKSKCKATTDAEGKTVYKYSITYRVRLENEKEGFAFDTARVTNGTAKLNYKVVKDNVVSDEKSALFPVPAVEGYKGKLVFTKTGKNNAGIAGAEFKLSHAGENCTVCKNDAVIGDSTATSGADGKVVFANIPSGHDYTLTETAAPDGYVLDTAVHKVDVDYGKTYLSGVEVTDAQPAAISNAPYAPDTYQIKASKTMSDGSALGTYTFVLKDADGNKIDEKSNDGTGAVAFDEIEYDAAGTYTYTVSEVRPEYVQGGDQNVNVIYDETIYGVEVVVGVNSEKTAYEVKEVNYTKIAKGEASKADSIKFENKLRGIAKVELTGTKTMDDVLAEENAFEFVLKDADGNVVETVKNGAEGKIAFTELTFDTPGTYNYTITETNAQDEDVVYDQTIYNVEIVVTCPKNNSDDYQAAVKVTNEGNESDVTFVNSTRKAAEVVLTATKEMNDETPADGAFYFLLTGDGINPQTKYNVGKDITFDTLYFEDAGTYTFTVSEVKGIDPDTVYDTTVYTAVVTVSVPEDGGDTFATDIVYKKGNEVYSEENVAVPFENFSRTHTNVPVEAVKTMDGEAAEAGAFTFVLEPSEFNTNELNERQEVKNGENGVIHFEDLEFGAEGTYVYHVYEVKGDDPHILYDDASYDVIVEVTAPEDDKPYQTSVKYELTGTSEGTNASVESMAFENLTREAATVVLEAEKTLDGKTPEADAFVFELKDEEGNVLQTKKNDAEGKVVFDEIIYDKIGTYTYTITEKAGKASNIEYDESEYTVTVEVEADTETEDPLQAIVTVEKDGEVFEGTPLFENKTLESVLDKIKTGDSSNIVLWMALIVLSGAAMFIAIRKKR